MRVFNPYDSDVSVKRERNVELFSPVSYVSGNLFEKEVFDADLGKKSGDLPEHLRKVYSEGCNHLTDEKSNTFKIFFYGIYSRIC